MPSVACKLRKLNKKGKNDYKKQLRALIAILVSGGIAFGVLWTQYKCQIKNGFKAAFKLGKAVSICRMNVFNEMTAFSAKTRILGEFCRTRMF